MKYCENMVRCQGKQTNTAHDHAEEQRDRHLGKRGDAAKGKQEWENP